MAGPLVLVVEDGPLAQMAREALEDAGYRVAIAGHGDEAPALARALQPRLILVRSAGRTAQSIKLASRLQADPATCGIPVLAMPATLGRIHALGPVDDTSARKPFHLDELVAAVARWVEP